MSIQHEQQAEQSGPSGRGSFSMGRLAIWLPGVLILGTLVAKAAADAQLYFAPLIIFPLLVGLALGGLLIGLMRMGQVGHLSTIILGTILAVSMAAVGQHVLCYLSMENADPRQLPIVDKAQRLFPELAGQRLQTPPASFMEYMRRQADRGRPLLFNYTARGWIVWLSWVIDGLLVLAGALAVVIPTMFLPFCGRCQTWYRVIRSAHVSASAIKQIGAIIDVEPVEHVKSGRCRLICCQSGCGPTGCELYWEDTTGDTFFARIWLDASQRNLAMQALDDVAHPQEDEES